MKRAAREPSSASVVWAVALLSAVTLFGVWIALAHRGPFAIDRWWSQLVSVSTGSLPNAVAIGLAEIGGGIGAAACTAIVAALLLVWRRGRDAASVVFALGLGVLTSELIKHLVMRPRPADMLYSASGFSFPSGHSMGAAALATSVLLVVLASSGVSKTTIRCTVAATSAWVLLMMWSRTALHVHWLTDTVAGALLGIAVAVLSRALWFRRAARGRKRNR